MTDDPNYRFGFACDLTIEAGKVKYGDYRISRGLVSKLLDVPPPPVFRNVVFDVLQEYEFYGGRLNIRHTIAYLHIDEPIEHDLVCLDVATLEPEDRIDSKRSIVPAKYDVFRGQRIEGTTYFLSDIYASVILASWNDDKKIRLIARRDSSDHWSRQAAFVDLEFAATRSGAKFSFKGNFRVRRHLLGELAGAAPIPEFPPEGELPRHAMVVAKWTGSGSRLRKRSSSPVTESLERIGQLLEYRGSQTVRILGTPGSGKEVVAQALHAGSVVSRGNKLRTRSMAGVRLPEFNQRLFSSQVGEPCLAEEANGGGTLFLDEFDKSDPEHIKPVCSTLLRILEADEYIREVVDYSGRRSERAAKLDKVNWIFAGAFTGFKMNRVPRDFWTRLTGTIRIKNPIQNDSEYAASLFLYFYLSEAIREFGPRHGIYFQRFISVLGKQESDRQFNEQVTARVLGEDPHIPRDPDRPLYPSAPLIAMARSFSKSVRTQRARARAESSEVDSPRGIRQAAKAAFYSMRQIAIESDGEFRFIVASRHALRAASEMLETTRGA